mmetsp:Transcript_3118/g.2591  ORF Transcript_3118/g.2591 Transcript_3118/m.2591 type:complete len:191 (+) Transcript_3118:399-971(+)
MPSKAMGQPEAAKSWAKNPQYLIDQKLDREVEFFFSLAQDDGRITRGSIFPFVEQIHPICLIIYPCDDGKKTTGFDGKKVKPQWISTVVEHKEVSLRATLPKGKYLAVPSTREPNSLGKYYLNIYFNAEIDDIIMKNLTNPDSRGPEIKEEDEDDDVSELRRTIVQARLVDLAPKNLDKSTHKSMNKFGF